MRRARIRDGANVASAIKAQGEQVRQLKAAKSPEAPAAVAALLALKDDLAKLIERLKVADVADE